MSVTYHMASHSVTRHPSQVIASHLNLQADRVVLHLLTQEGW